MDPHAGELNDDKPIPFLGGRTGRQALNDLLMQATLDGKGMLEGMPGNPGVPWPKFAVDALRQSESFQKLLEERDWQDKPGSGLDQVVGNLPPPPEGASDTEYAAYAMAAAQYTQQAASALRGGSSDVKCSASGSQSDGHGRGSSSRRKSHPESLLPGMEEAAAKLQGNKSGSNTGGGAGAGASSSSSSTMANAGHHSSGQHSMSKIASSMESSMHAPPAGCSLPYFYSWGTSTGASGFPYNGSKSNQSGGGEASAGNGNGGSGGSSSVVTAGSGSSSGGKKGGSGSNNNSKRNNTGKQGSSKSGNPSIWDRETDKSEQDKLREFWLSLPDKEQRDLVKIEKQAILKEMKGQQRYICSCSVCGRRREVLEEELEMLYDAYYEELAQQEQDQLDKFISLQGNQAVAAIEASSKCNQSSAQPPKKKKKVKKKGQKQNGKHKQNLSSDDHQNSEDDEESGEEEDDEEGFEGPIIEEIDPTPQPAAAPASSSHRNASSLYFDSGDDYVDDVPYDADFDDDYGEPSLAHSLTVKGDVLTVTDELLENGGSKFFDLMMRIAESRYHYQDDFDAMNAFDDDDDEDDDDFDDLSEEDSDFLEEQRMEEGRRMFQMFAARMIEQRLLVAYREKAALEAQEQLIREEEEGERLTEERNRLKREKEKERKKKRKQQKKAQKAADEAEKLKLKEMEENAKLEAKKQREAQKLADLAERQRQRQQEEKARNEELARRAAELKAAEEERKRTPASQPSSQHPQQAGEKGARKSSRSGSAGDDSVQVVNAANMAPKNKGKKGEHRQQARINPDHPTGASQQSDGSTGDVGWETTNRKQRKQQQADGSVAPTASQQKQPVIHHQDKQGLISVMRLASSPSAKGQKGGDDSNKPLDDLGAIAQHHSKQQQRSHPHYPPRPHHPVISQQERESLDAELSDMLELLPGDLLGSSNNDTVAAPESVSPATQQARSPPFSQKWNVPSPDVVPSSANWEQGSGATDHRQQQQQQNMMHHGRHHHVGGDPVGVPNGGPSVSQWQANGAPPPPTSQQQQQQAFAHANGRMPLHQMGHTNQMNQQSRFAPAHVSPNAVAEKHTRMENVMGIVCGKILAGQIQLPLGVDTFWMLTQQIDPFFSSYSNQTSVGEIVNMWSMHHRQGRISLATGADRSICIVGVQPTAQQHGLTSATFARPSQQWPSLPVASEAGATKSQASKPTSRPPGMDVAPGDLNLAPNAKSDQDRAWGAFDGLNLGPGSISFL